MGYGVEFYAPIERGLDSIDQNLNLQSKRADDREARGMQQLLMSSQMQTAQENRGLDRRAAERQDERLAMAISAAEASRKQSIIDENRNATIHAQAIKNFDVANMEADEKRQQFKIQNTPKPVNMYEQYGGKTDRLLNLLSSEKSKAIIESIHGPNTRFDPATGLLYRKDNGEKIMISEFKYDNQFAAKLFNLPYLITDPQAISRGDQAEDKQKLIGLTEAYKKYSSPNNKGVDINVANKNKIKVQIKKLEAKMIKSSNISTSEFIDRYIERQDGLTKFALANKYNPELLTQVAAAQTQNKAMLDRLYRKQNAELKAQVDSLKTTGGNVVNKVLKELRSSYEARVKIRMNAIKGIDPMLTDYNEHVERIESESYTQEMIIASEYMKKGGNPADLGRTEEEIEAFDKEAEAEKWKPSTETTKAAITGKLKYNTPDKIAAAVATGVLDRDIAIQMLQEL